MYTANTMASAIEAMGMSLPNSSAQNAISPAKRDDCRRAGACVVEMLEKGLHPRDIMTRKAFENAITVIISLGGSTNAVLHLLAIAHAAKVDQVAAGPADDAAFEAYLEQNRTERHGSHSYAPPDFGLSEDQLQRDFAFYTEVYL